MTKAPFVTIYEMDRATSQPVVACTVEAPEGEAAIIVGPQADKYRRRFQTALPWLGGKPIKTTEGMKFLRALRREFKTPYTFCGPIEYPTLFTP